MRIVGNGSEHRSGFGRLPIRLDRSGAEARSAPRCAQPIASSATTPRAVEAEADGGTAARHRGDPRDQQRRRLLQHRRERRYQPSDRARQHSVHADRLGGRRREQVRERRDDRHGSERREQDRRDPDLRGERHGERAAQPYGPGNRARNGPESVAIPALAPHDSQNATEWSRNGSSTSNAMIASASARTLDAGRPTNDDPNATIASADARSTDGSKRVIVANINTITAAATVRRPSESRRNNGPNSASVNATFSPDTASRCDSPESR